MKVSYVKTQLQSVVNISKVVTIHYNEYDKLFVFEGEKHDFWEMVYIDKGRVEVRRDDETIALSQGEIIFHKPNEFHSIKALDSEPNYFIISFVCNSPLIKYLEKYHAVLDKTLLGFISAIIKEAENTYYVPRNTIVIPKLVKKSSATIGGEQLIKTYLGQLLIFIIRNIIKKDPPAFFPSKESMETHLVRSAKQILTEKADSTFNVNDLCQELGYSRSYLSKLFREQTGETIANFFTKQKINQAKQLIREGDLNFAQISDMLCFDNPQYFSRVFKRITGMTPTEFKASLKGIS